MPRVHLMSDHRRFTGGEAVVEAGGATVGAVIAELEQRFPGLGDALTHGASAGVNGEIHSEPQYLEVDPDTDIYFVAPLTGG
ncbi:MAG: MoaD/ThiS family protein [Actinobacteria bacterium]|nr:MoaD/ThiS family protein [Actinomycetota bacterium]